MIQKKTTFFHIPITQEEVYQFSFISGDYADFFKKLLTTKRPYATADTYYMMFMIDPLTPNKISWGNFNNKQQMLRNNNIESREISGLLKKYGRENPNFTVSTKRNIIDKPKIQSKVLSRQKSAQLSVLLQKEILRQIQNLEKKVLLGKQSLQRLENPPPSTTETVLLLVILFLGLGYLFKWSRVVPLIEHPAFTETITRFIGQIQQQQKRSTFIKLLNELRDRKRDSSVLHHFQKSLKDPKKFSYLQRFINEALNDQDVLAGLNAFLSSITDPRTRSILKNIIQETAKKELPKIQSKIQQQKSQHQQKQIVQQQKEKKQIVQKQEQQQQKQIVQKLFEFFRTNKQRIVSQHGAVSPVFINSLKKELRLDDPSFLAHIVSQKARQIVRQEPNVGHRIMTDKLLHMLSQTQFLRRLKTRQFPPKLSKITLSPMIKRRVSRKTYEPQQQQKQQQKKQQQRIEPVLEQLVKRSAKQKQKKSGGDAIIEMNIGRILYESKSFKEITPLLIQIIRVRQIKKVYFVDAPNILQPFFSRSFTARQKYASDPAFVMVLRSMFNDFDEKSMFVIVSQMNRADMKNNDPIFFGRPNDDDKNNIFIVRVACYYTDDKGEEKDCYNFPIGGGNHLGNECDDFVRLDLTARLIHTLQKQKQQQQPEKIKFFLVSNDRHSNWTIDDPKINKEITFIKTKPKSI